MADLLPASAVDRLGAEELRQVLRWLRTYVGAKNAEPALERTYVCPFIPDALERDTLWFAMDRSVVDGAAAEAFLLDCAKDFLTLEPTTGPEVRYKAIIAVFPSVSERAAHEAIDDVQKRLKPTFVENLMMIGELHPWNVTEAKGFEGKGLYPNRSPIPALAIRTIVNQDKKFLYQSLDVSNSLADNLQFWKYRRAWLRAMLLWGNPDWIKRYRSLAEEVIEMASASIDQIERILGRT